MKMYVSERQGQLVSFSTKERNPVRRHSGQRKQKVRYAQFGVKKVKALLPGTVSTSSDDSPGQAQQAETERKGCKLGWKLIAELKAAAERVGMEVPIATEGDEISGFGSARAGG